MERILRFLILSVLWMLGFINAASAAEVANSFSWPLASYTTDDGCREWEWYGDYNGDGSSEYHLADDVCAASGTPVYAVANGVVKAALAYTPCPDWEYLIDVEHTMPDGSKVTSIYGHTQPISGITVGTSVTEGQQIGTVIDYCSGDHLHFGIYDGPYTDIACSAIHSCLTAGYSSSVGNYVDPVKFITDNESICTTSTYSINLVTAEASGTAYNLNGFAEEGTGDSATFAGAGTLQSATGSTSSHKFWLVGNVNADSWDDVVEITDSGSYTYAQVYTGFGGDGLNSRTQWIKTTKGLKKAFLEDMDNDGDDDLILGYDSSGNMSWKYYLSNGSTGFGSANTWSTSFGKTTDIFVMGDFKANGKGELLRGQEADGTTGSNFTSALTWQRLPSGGGSTSTVYTGYGYSGDQWIVEDVDSDGDDDLVRIGMNNSTVGVHVAMYGSSSFGTPTKYVSDAGGNEGHYYFYPIDYIDDYTDLLRVNTSGSLYMGRSDVGAIWWEEQTSQSVMLSGISTSAEYLFGYFGDYDVTVCE